MTDERLRSTLAELPREPGVYLFRDAAGELIYVGKAKSLRSRVRSYFRAEAGRHPRIRRLVAEIDAVETILAGSEAEALLLESTLIREHAPRYNIQLRDDKSYPYVKVTVQEPFPRVLVTRRLERDGSRYFGPFTNVKAMRRALRVIKSTFTVRSCDYPLPDRAPERPCLDYHIERCKAPCVGYQSVEDYRAMIDQILEILGGRTAALHRDVTREMEEAAEALEYERAAELRDVLKGLDVLRRRQTTVDFRGGDRDVLGIARSGAHTCAVLLRVRDGHLLGRDARFLREADDTTMPELVGAAVRDFYLPAADVPEEILVAALPEDVAVLAEVLGGRHGSEVQIIRPNRGQKRRLLELAEENARHLAEERTLTREPQSVGDVPRPAARLAEALDLPAPARSIVCFDISTLGGRDSVGSAVWLRDGRPDKSGYRRFRIRETADGETDDYAMMQEVVGRYFHRRIAEEGALPDLVLIDGGKGQLGAALQGMESAGASDLPVAALAKRLEEIFLPGRDVPVRFRSSDPALHWLQRARNEAHRFAVGYNRRLRRRRTLHSRLSEIEGVGPRREADLLRHFGSVAAIRRSSVAELTAVQGIGRATAERILEELGPEVGT
ncbi:MAG: excinuclease ABC subunit UvrC [Gemmatimonadales bacterium]|jgi:excinuclease ABC subunit C